MKKAELFGFSFFCDNNIQENYLKSWSNLSEDRGSGYNLNSFYPGILLIYFSISLIC